MDKDKDKVVKLESDVTSKLELDTTSYVNSDTPSKLKPEWETNPPEDSVVAGSIKFQVISEWEDKDEEEEEASNFTFTSYTYNCVVCLEQFTDGKAMLKHRSIGHADGGIDTCLDCDEVFTTKEEGRAHRDVHKRRIYFCCDVCEEDYYEGGEYLDHRITHVMLDSEYKCDACDRTSVHSKDNEFWLARHLAIHANTRKHICECGKRYLKQHQYKSHKANCSKCKICGKLFFNLDSLETHKRIAHVQAEHNCPNESVVHSGKEKKTLHSEQGEETLYCNFCGRHFDKLFSLESHVEYLHLSQSVETYNQLNKKGHREIIRMNRRIGKEREMEELNNVQKDDAPSPPIIDGENTVKDAPPPSKKEKLTPKEVEPSKEVEPPKYFVCFFCNMKFPEVGKLDMHILKDHPIQYKPTYQPPAYKSRRFFQL